ncbi:MAG: carbohydrate ABC transporter permease [Oscillospiraceae bacterium]|jgi:multiple sugar transport system permease protein|nr:carbohydrate ABC transporter permease [Oscillospiraceae bacterium]MDD3261517.1 carbohydrate ABC transporter permease [Oscillospiraceae bacterium]
MTNNKQVSTEKTSAFPEIKSGKGKLTAARVGCYIVLCFLCFLCLFFFYMLLINSSRNTFQIQQGFSFLPGRSFWINLNNTLNNANIPVLSGIMNSLIVSALSALLATYFSTLTAYAIHAYDFKLKKAAFALILLIMTMPTQISAVGFVNEMTAIGLKNSLIPLFLPAIASPVVFFFMKQYMDSNMPMEIVEAARIDGSSEFMTFNKIVLPIMKPAIAVQAIFTFVGAWNNYFVPALLLDSANKKTLPILIAQLRGADFLKFDMGQVYMLITIAIVPVIIVYLCLSKFIVRGVALGGVKG